MTTVAELTDDQIAARLAEVHTATQAKIGGVLYGPTPSQLLASVYAERDAEVEQEAAKRYRYVRPLTEAADSLIEYLQNADGRIMTGLREIDVMTRGFGAGELVYIIGYSHSGKTQLMLTTILHNRDKPIVFFTADEPAELVLTKLIAMRTRSNAERMEERVKAGDPDACDRIRRIARHDFSNLIIVDQSMSLSDMSTAVEEAQDYWQAPVAAVGFDYLELLRSDTPEVERKSQEFKAWAMSQSFPSLVLHQGSRGNSAGGQKLTMRSGKFGGEQEAIFLIGVRRARDNDEGCSPLEVDTVDISLLKCKRPPSKIGEHRYYMEPSSGLILPMEAQPEPMSTASEALAARAGKF